MVVVRVVHLPVSLSFAAAAASSVSNSIEANLARPQLIEDIRQCMLTVAKRNLSALLLRSRSGERQTHPFDLPLASSVKMKTSFTCNGTLRTF